MMSERKRAVLGWLPYLDLACAFGAGVLWYAWPQGWPLVIALVPWAIRLALTGRPTRRTPFDLPLALFLLTALVATWVSFDRGAAWARFWLIVGGVVLFYALANAVTAGNMRIWFLALLGAGAAVVFVVTNDWSASAAKIGLLTRLGRALQAWFPRLPGLDANAYIAASIPAMLLPFAGLVAVQAWEKLRRERGAGSSRATSLLHPALSAGLAFGLGMALLLLVAFGWVMAASRAAWAAVLGALLLAGVWCVAGWLSRSNATMRAGILIACLGLALLVILVVAVARPAAIAALLDALPGPSAVGSRIELWRNSLLLVRDYPFTGVGHDGFMMAYSTYVMLLHVGFAPHAHNLFLDMAVEQGLPALCIWLWMCAMFLRELWRDQTRPDAESRSTQIGAAALSLCVILLHGLVDDPLYTSRAVLFLFVPLALAGAPAYVQDVGRRRTSHWIPLALAIGIIALVAWFWRAPVLSQVASNLGAVYQTRTELGVYTWPDWSIQDEVRRHVDLDPAVAQFERALGLDAGNASANRRLGQIELSLGQYAAALGHLQAAYAAEPWSNATRELLGEAYLANGRQEAGRLLWAGVSNEQGQLQNRVWWYEHIGEVERAEWMRWAAGSES